VQNKYCHFYFISYLFYCVVWWKIAFTPRPKGFCSFRSFQVLDFVSNLKHDLEPAKPHFRPYVRNILFCRHPHPSYGIFANSSYGNYWKLQFMVSWHNDSWFMTSSKQQDSLGVCYIKSAQTNLQTSNYLLQFSACWSAWGCLPYPWKQW
jgi:hypothetical protein